MKLLVGLGNPGPRYAETRHNLGCMALDVLARHLGAAFRAGKNDGLVASVPHVAHGKVLFLKPQTFMNRSGLCVAGTANFHKIEPADILVVHDDLDLPLGRLRFASKGSAGGHRGIASVIESLGSGEFLRLKLGIGRPPDPRADPVNYVLGAFARDEQHSVAEVLLFAAEALKFFLANDLEKAMNRYNGGGQTG